MYYYYYVLLLLCIIIIGFSFKAPNLTDMTEQVEAWMSGLLPSVLRGVGMFRAFRAF